VVDFDPEYQYNKTMFNAIESILKGLSNIFVGIFYLIWYAWMGLVALMLYIIW
jgi:hypothetical protein